MLMRRVVQDPHQVKSSGAVTRGLPGKGQMRRTERGNLASFMLACCVSAAIFGTGAALVQAATADASPGDTPQHQAWDILQTGVTDKSTARRTQAVLALRLLHGNQKGVDAAEAAIDDKEPEVRAAAATALGQMNSTSSIPKLTKMLSDKQASVVLAAARALHDLNDPVAYSVFYEVLTGERKPGDGLIGEGEETLKDGKKTAEFGLEEGIGFVPFAGAGYTAVKAATKDTASPIRAAAAKILATDTDPRSGEALIRAVSDKKWMVQVAALEALAKRGDPSFLGGVVPAMSDKNDAVRFTAAATVLRLSSITKAVASAKPKRSRRSRAKPRGSSGTANN
jgi:HEAT repeat protein